MHRHVSQSHRSKKGKDIKKSLFRSFMMHVGRSKVFANFHSSVVPDAEGIEHLKDILNRLRDKKTIKERGT
uniref:Uncharacterized protein n=1 Tax=Helianthus annuus TaxID=4232 RepID=A0A251SHD8_HELAN